jgi:hypothetical protein
MQPGVPGRCRRLGHQQAQRPRCHNAGQSHRFAGVQRQSAHVEMTTVVCGSVMPALCSGPEMARPVNVSTADQVVLSYMNLFERDNSPEVRSRG